MAKRIAVVITEDPRQTHRPVEALRIALGLCAGEHETTVILLGRASLLLTDDIDEVVDVDVLEKYRPSFQHLNVPFILEQEGAPIAVIPAFSVSRRSQLEINSLLHSVDRTLVFT
ncbi:MAG: hypothetical protein GDA67_09055 [Nitrospira sp. CR1.3]|nr:hypothetical protein [Nitrospira sp. CR1.3]